MKGLLAISKPEWPRSRSHRSLCSLTSPSNPRTHAMSSDISKSRCTASLESWGASAATALTLMTMVGSYDLRPSSSDCRVALEPSSRTAPPSTRTADAICTAQDIVFCLTPFCYPQVIPRHRGLTWVASGQILGNGTAADALRGDATVACELADRSQAHRARAERLRRTMSRCIVCSSSGVHDSHATRAALRRSGR